MIGSYKFQPRMKNAEHKFNVIKAKVNEQKEKMTTQQELAFINNEIDQYAARQQELAKKLEQAENGLKDQKEVIVKLEKENGERKAELASVNKENLGISY